VQPPSLSRYVEPFVGGGAVALAVAQTHPGLSLYLNDADARVAALWLVLSQRQDDAYEKLVRRLESTVPTVDLWREERAARFAGSYDDLAFRALFLNRCTFSGGMSFGSGGPIGGYDQTGKWKIDARWKLGQLLPNLDKVRDLLSSRRVVVTAGRWEEAAAIAGYQYYDPPYITPHAKHLYSSFFTIDDHLALRDHLRKLRYPWVLSYDSDPDGHVAWMYSFANREEVNHSSRIQKAGPQDRAEVLFWMRPRRIVNRRGTPALPD
jgi:DNA adenine methylase